MKTINILTISMGAGGAEKTISLLLPELIKDYKVNLILFNDVRHFNIPKEVNVILLSPKNKHSFLKKISSIFVLPFYFKKIIKQTNPTISISFLTRPNLLNGLFKRKNIKTIISERCFPSIAYKSSKYRYAIYKFLIPLLYNKADVLFSNSTHINQDLKENFKLKIPMKVIYNPIEIPESNSKINLSKKDIDIIWVGKLNNIKNPGLLIRALNYSVLNINATYLGEGFLLNDLKQQSQELQVEFNGKVNNVGDYLKRSKVLVLTSMSEGFPNVILEGMSYGLPIISTDCLSGPLELLNDNVSVKIPKGEFLIAKFGILINVDDEVALNKAMKNLFSDANLYNRLAQVSKTRAQDYSVSKIYKQLRSIIEE